MDRRFWASPSLVASGFVSLLVVLFPALVASETIEVGGACTLADAIRSANTDTAVGGCVAGDGVDEVVLTEDVLLDEIDNATLGNNGLPLIESELTIDGAGFSVTRSTDPGTPDFRIFHVSDARLTLRNTTIANGVEPVGAAILATGAVGSSLIVLEAIIRDNDGSGIEAFGAAGDELTLADVGLVRNTGTGVRATGDLDFTVVNSRIADNATSVPAAGGGVYSGAGNTSIQSTTISGNSAQTGAGVHFGAAAGDAVVSYAAVSGNTATGDGGGLFHGTPTGILTIRNVTISGNTAGGVGGGISIDDGASSQFVYASVLDNGAVAGGNFAVPVTGRATLTNSIVAASAAGTGCDGDGFENFGGNFTDDMSCFGDPIVVGVDIEPTLADNGGGTETHALLPGSVALNFSGDCLFSNDQRGWLRDGECDAGAFELGAIEQPVVTVVGVCPGYSTLTVSGLTPNQPARVARGADLGLSMVPGGPCAGTLLDLDSASLLISGDANNRGALSRSGDLSPAICGSYVQAYDRTTCVTSLTDQIPETQP